MKHLGGPWLPLDSQVGFVLGVAYWVCPWAGYPPTSVVVLVGAVVVVVEVWLSGLQESMAQPIQLVGHPWSGD